MAAPSARLGLLFLSLCFASFAKATVSVTNSDYQQLAETLHSFPHISFWKYEKDVTFNTNASYFESMGFLAAPFVIIGVLLLIIGITFGSCRCLGHCGGSKPKRDGYTSCERNSTRISLIIFLLLIFIFCGGGIWGSVRFHETLPSMLDRTEDTGFMLLNQAEIVEIDIESLQDYITDTGELQLLQDDASKLANDLSNHRSDIDAVEMARYIGDLFSFCIVVATGCVGIIAFIAAWGRPSFGFVVVFWVVLILMWAWCGLHLSASVAVGDLCESVDEYLQEDFFESGDTAEIVSHYLFCSGSDPLPMLTSEIQNFTRLANESLVNATREGNQTAIDYWTTILDQATTLQNDVDILLDCSITAANYNQTKEDLCTDILLGSFVMLTSQFFIGVLGLAVLIIGIVGQKRLPHPKGYIEIGGEEDYVQKERLANDAIPFGFLLKS